MPLQSVFHPSDFSAASEVAFAHALRVALAARAGLHMLHFNADPDRETGRFPRVREMLERWNRIPPGSGKEAVEALGLVVRKVHSNHEDPVQASLAYLAQHPTDLIVLATHRRNGRGTWSRRSVASPIARSGGGMTLFVPEGIEGFVSPRDGSLRLRQVLIPIAKSPPPAPAVTGCLRLARALGLANLDARLLHVGAEGGVPGWSPPGEAGWRWTQEARRGNVVRTILSQAADPPADLIVMATRGPHGFLDALRGSTTEQVIRRAPCPVLAIQTDPPTS